LLSEPTPGCTPEDSWLSEPAWWMEERLLRDCPAVCTEERLLIALPAVCTEDTTLPPWCADETIELRIQSTKGAINQSINRSINASIRSKLS
jgi:hypothetical protein